MVATKPRPAKPLLESVEEEGVVVKPGHNEMRRLMYKHDADYADRQRELSRRSYRKDNPLPPSPLEGGLLEDGVLREVYTEGVEEVYSTQSYTVPEAARALGKSYITLKRWVRDGLIPAPILRDAHRQHRLYGAGELQEVCRVLAQHGREFSYYAKMHETTRSELFAAVERHRASN